MEGTGGPEHAVASGKLLVRHTRRQLVRVALGYRALVTVVAVTITATSSDISTGAARWLIVVGGAVVLAHVALILRGGDSPLTGTTTWVVAGDVGAAVLLNLWASSTIIPAGLLYQGFGDPFGAYGIGTVALWAAVKGPRLGAFLLVAVMLPLQLAMAVANEATIGSYDAARFVMRCVWLITAFVVGGLLWNALRTGSAVLAAHSERTGRAIQRRQTLDTLHNVVLQTVMGIDRLSSNPGPDQRAVLDTIATEARRRSAEVRGLIADDTRDGDHLVPALRRLVAEVDGRGTIGASLVGGDADPVLEPAVARAMLGATREALNNAERHSGAAQVDVAVEMGGGEVRVVVSDDGAGFDASATTEGYGIAHSIRERLDGVEGSAHLTTSPGRGTRWELSVPSGGRAGDDPGRRLISLVDRTIAAYSFVPLAYRALGLLIAIAGLAGSGSFGPIAMGPVVTVLAGLVLVHVGVIAAAARNPRLLRSRCATVADLLAAAGLTLWAGLAVPNGTIYLDNRALFTVYGQATVALWTGFRSTVLGMVLVVVFGFPLQLGAAALNGIPPASAQPLTLAARAVWLAVAYFLARGIVVAVRRGGRLIAADRERAGREAERSLALEALGRTVLAGLDGIVHRAEQRTDSPATDLRAVGVGARRLAAEIKPLLRAADLQPRGLQAVLESLVTQFELRGTLEPELIVCDVDADGDPQRRAPLVRALTEILEACEHVGGARKVTVFVESGDHRVGAVVTDPGAQKDCYSAVLTDLSAQLTAAGGGIQLDATLAGGSRWELWIPTDRARMAPPSARWPG